MEVKRQKGFLALGYIIMIVGALSIFGATFFAMADDSIMCMSGNGCGNLATNLGKFLVAPQLRMSEAIDILNTPDLEPALASHFRNEIIMSIAIFLLLFIIIFWLMVKLVTTMNFFDYIVAFILTIVIMMIMEMAIMWLMTGTVHIPFQGWFKLVQNPAIMIDTINYSELLPLNNSINKTNVL